jgi:ADP-heptose:LPS heptosyltransferase
MQLEIVLTETERATALSQWDTGNRHRVLINISAGKAFRHWPDENFVAVARHLKSRLPGSCIMILHSPAELKRAQDIAREAGVARAETPGVREALALVATANFVFTPDTSILHAASAFRIPTVAMITYDQAQRWGLFGTIGEVVISSGKTLASLPLEKVIDAINNILFKSAFVKFAGLPLESPTDNDVTRTFPIIFSTATGL